MPQRKRTLYYNFDVFMQCMKITTIHSEKHNKLINI